MQPGSRAKHKRNELPKSCHCQKVYHSSSSAKRGQLTWTWNFMSCTAAAQVLQKLMGHYWPVTHVSHEITATHLTRDPLTDCQLCSGDMATIHSTEPSQCTRHHGLVSAYRNTSEFTIAGGSDTHVRNVKGVENGEGYPSSKTTSGGSEKA